MLIILKRSKISVQKLKVGGIPILKALAANQKNTNHGDQDITPELKKNNREPERANKAPTPKKRAEEVTP